MHVNFLNAYYDGPKFFEFASINVKYAKVIYAKIITVSFLTLLLHGVQEIKILIMVRERKFFFLIFFIFPCL